MTDEEMMEIYKSGQKPESMSNKDWETGYNQYLGKQGQQLLSDNLAKQQAGLAQGQKNAQQSASISSDKIMKYLGQAQLASGVATGQTGTSFINANNAYQQNRAAISTNYSAQHSDLLQRYAGESLQLTADTHNNNTNILDKHYGREYQESQDALAQENWLKQFGLSQAQFDHMRDMDEKSLQMELNRIGLAREEYEEGVRRYNQEYSDSRSDSEESKKQEQSNATFSHAQSMLDNYLDSFMEDNILDSNEYNQALEYLSKFGDSLSDTQKQELTDGLDYYRESGKKIEDDMSGRYSVNSSMGSKGIIVDGVEYAGVSVGKKASSEIINATKSLPNNTTFVYGDKIYLKTESGEVREMSSGGNPMGGLYFVTLLGTLKSKGYVLG